MAEAVGSAGQRFEPTVTFSFGGPRLSGQACSPHVFGPSRLGTFNMLFRSERGNTCRSSLIRIGPPDLSGRAALPVLAPFLLGNTC
jgi:hypothetical protein